MRNSFVMYRSYWKAMQGMNEEDKLTFFNALCNYAFEGIEPELTGVPSMAFLMARPNVDASNGRYDRCVENGKKGAEFGKKGGRRRKGETREEYLERKGLKTPVETPRNNQENLEENGLQKPQEKPQEKPLNYNLDYDDNLDVDVNLDDELDVNLKENNSQYINTQLPKENNLEEIEKIFRNKLREGDNRKWVTEYKTFYDLTQNFEFDRWIISLPEEVSDNLSSIWYKFKKTFVSRNS